MGLLGILLALGVLIGLAYRGWSVLLLAPVAALLADSAARFLAQFFPLFLLDVTAARSQPSPHS